MKIIILALAGAVVFLCWAMLNNCLNVMKNVKKKDKDE